MNQAQTKLAICKGCHNLCPVDVDIVDGRVVHVRGVKDDPVHMGFSCKRGRELPEIFNSSARLLHAQRRLDDNNFAPIESSAALDEIAARLRAIIAKHGPRSVALYLGTHSLLNPTSSSFAGAFMEAIGSPMTFTTITIDCPGRILAGALHGAWLGRGPTVASADVILLIGANPPVSFLGPVPHKRRLRDSQSGGATLAVIDPRQTEVARMADIYLQPRPGTDALILAAALNTVFAEGLEDVAFLANHVTGVAELKAAVAPFTPALVAERASVAAEDIVAIARAFGSGRGMCNVGTGPNMSGHGTLTEYLALALMTVAGAWNREGERVPDYDVLIRTPEPCADVLGPFPAWGFGETLRVRGLGATAAGLPTAALADEILFEGEGQVRALISVGGNPATAWPDQMKTAAALEKLELLVMVDPEMNLTSRYADYVIAPKICYEHPTDSSVFEMLGFAYPNIGSRSLPHGRALPAIVDAPPGSDVMEDWEVFYELARRMDLTLNVTTSSQRFVERNEHSAFTLDPNRKPTAIEVHEAMFAGSPIPYAELARHRGGLFRPDAFKTVGPARSQTPGRLMVGDPQMIAQLSAQLRPAMSDPAYPFRLVSRRQGDRFNSSWHGYHRGRTDARPYNPAYMNPQDLAQLGLASGQIVTIVSARAAIKGVVAAEPELKPGIVSMTHGWGGLPGDDESPLGMGSSTARLCDSDQCEPHAGIPLMSAIPVMVRPG